MYLGIYCFVQIQAPLVPTAEYPNTIQGTEGGNLFARPAQYSCAHGLSRFQKMMCWGREFRGEDTKIVVVAGVLPNLPTPQPQGFRRAMCSVCRDDEKRAAGVLLHSRDSQWVKKLLSFFTSTPGHFLMSTSVCMSCAYVCAKLQV